MKTFPIIASIFLATAFIACDKSAENTDTEVHVVDENSMAATQKLDVEVVNSIDPVCEMEMPKYLSDTLTYDSHLYGFCSKSCKDDFEKTPEEFVKKLAELKENTEI
ncbi:MAG: YHS domain-containing protein [Weeksellaceae bacterium]